MQIRASDFSGKLDVLYMRLGAVLMFSLFSTTAPARQPREVHPAQTQQQGSQSPQSPQTFPQATNPSGLKPRKIWTNDDVVALRTPEDIYVAEKEAQLAADSKAAAQTAELEKRIKQAGLKIELPHTPEETQRLIKDREGRIKDLQERLSGLSQALLAAPADQRASTLKEIETLTLNSQKAELELGVLQDHLANFVNVAPKENEASSPKPAPPAPPDSQ